MRHAASSGQEAADKPAAVPQAVTGRLTRAAIFLVVTIDPDPAAATAVRALVSDIGAIVRPIGFREPDGALSCVVGFGSDVWDRLFGPPRPAELHPFREIRVPARHAVATPGDVLFHIRAERLDLCFELAASIMTTLGGAIAIADEVQGFQYFDRRDLLGFVDGTENPEDQEAIDAALDRRRGSRFRRRELRDRAEISARYGRLERPQHGGAGAHHRPHQAGKRRPRRRDQADRRAQRADHHRRGRQGDKDPACQHAVRSAGTRGIRHIFHWLQPIAADHRANAGEHVHRPATGQLRSVARFQPPDHRYIVLRTRNKLSSGRRPRCNSRCNSGTAPRRHGRRPIGAACRAGARTVRLASALSKETPNNEQPAPRACADLRCRLGADRRGNHAYAEALPRSPARGGSGRLRRASRCRPSAPAICVRSPRRTTGSSHASAR